MFEQLSWKIGGQQGDGIESAGSIFATTLNRLGYYLYGYRQFSSRIRGGHTDNTLRIGVRALDSVADNVELLVAFDQETLSLSAAEVAAAGIILADTAFSPTLPAGAAAPLCAIPLTELAKAAGSVMQRNVVAIGATAAVMGLPPEPFLDVVGEWYQPQGPKIVADNRQAFEAGYRSIQEHQPQSFRALPMQPGDGQERIFGIGNEAIALGAIAGGCRFLSAYPITPSSEIMEYMIKRLPELGGIAVQTEDEIAACTMAIGAAYAGARAMTASSGPGLALKTEAIGLAGMTETPLVIVDTQRAGPSTGMPTKQEQADLLAMLFGTPGEIPKIVLAPGDVEEAFYDAAEAFNLAEEYQCPVILLTDLQLSLGLQTAEPYNLSRVAIRRGKLADPATLPPIENPTYFNRYQVTEDGISPRTIPGMKYGIHHVTGLEHAESGKPSEEPANRRRQMEKRLRKTRSLPDRFPTPVWTDGESDAASDILLIGMGSTRGAIREAARQLRQDGHRVRQAHLRLLWPFPAEQLTPLLRQARHILVVENNATAQLAGLIRMQTSGGVELKSILKYDGRLFTPGEIYRQCKEMI